MKTTEQAIREMVNAAYKQHGGKGRAGAYVLRRGRGRSNGNKQKSTSLAA
jgi:hypothetical protein